MKEYEFEIKIKEMLVDVQKNTFKESIRLFNCGGVDPEEFESDYLLPKIILNVALKNIVNQYKPLSGEGKEVAKNLECF